MMAAQASAHFLTGAEVYEVILPDAAILLSRPVSASPSAELVVEVEVEVGVPMVLAGEVLEMLKARKNLVKIPVDLVDIDDADDAVGVVGVVGVVGAVGVVVDAVDVVAIAQHHQLFLYDL